MKNGSASNFIATITGQLSEWNTRNSESGVMYHMVVDEDTSKFRIWIACLYCLLNVIFSLFSTLRDYDLIENINCL